MARLIWKNTGVVVTVDDEKAERLGAEWSPAEAEESKPKRSTRAKKSE